MENNKLVTIIVPVYKAEKYIKECVESLINQTYKKLQIIFVIDGNMDNSKNIIEEYCKTDSRIEILEKQNTGAIDSRKQGLKIAKGEYVFFVDSDDWIFHETIQEMLEIAQKYNCDVVKSGMVRQEPKNDRKLLVTNQVCEYIEKENFEHTIYKSILTSYTHNSMVSTLIRKEKIIIDKIRTDIRLGEDLNFNIELYGNINNIVLLNKCYYYYRYNPKSETNQLNLEKLKIHMRDIENVGLNVMQSIKKWDIKDEKLKKQAYMYLYLKIVKYSLKVYSIKNITKTDRINFLKVVSNMKIVEEIRKLISLSDINRTSIKNRILIKALYKQNLSQLNFCGKVIYYVLKR